MSIHHVGNWPRQAQRHGAHRVHLGLAFSQHQSLGWGAGGRWMGGGEVDCGRAGGPPPKPASRKPYLALRIPIHAIPSSPHRRACVWTRARSSSSHSLPTTTDNFRRVYPSARKLQPAKPLVAATCGEPLGLLRAAWLAWRRPSPVGLLGALPRRPCQESIVGSRLSRGTLRRPEVSMPNPDHRHEEPLERCQQTMDTQYAAVCYCPLVRDTMSQAGHIAQIRSDPSLWRRRAGPAREPACEASWFSCNNPASNLAPAHIPRDATLPRLHTVPVVVPLPRPPSRARPPPHLSARPS